MFPTVHVPHLKDRPALCAVFPMPIGMQRKRQDKEKIRKKRKNESGRNRICPCLRNAPIPCAVLEPTVPPSLFRLHFQRTSSAAKLHGRSLAMCTGAVPRKVTHLPGPCVVTGLVPNGKAGFQRGVELAAVLDSASLPPHVVVNIHRVAEAVGKISRGPSIDGWDGGHAVR